MYNSKIENRLMEQKLNEELEADNMQVCQPNANTNVTCRLLSVGDRIYSDHRLYGMSVCTIEKTTRTQAVSGNDRFKIEVGHNGWVKKIGSTSACDTPSYCIETPEIKEKYFRHKTVQKLKSVDFSKLSTDVLKELLSLVNGR